MQPSACPPWQPDHAANAAQELRSYTTAWNTIIVRAGPNSPGTRWMLCADLREGGYNHSAQNCTRASGQIRGRRQLLHGIARCGASDSHAPEGVGALVGRSPARGCPQCAGGAGAAHTQGQHRRSAGEHVGGHRQPRTPGRANNGTRRGSTLGDNLRHALVCLGPGDNPHGRPLTPSALWGGLEFAVPVCRRSHDGPTTHGVGFAAQES
jgi:hypothetical protein